MTRWLYVAIALTVLTAGTTAYLYVFRFDLFPEQVPTHWNARGVADSWTPRDQVLPYLILMPATMVGFVLLTPVLAWISPKSFEVDRFRNVYGYVMFLAVAMMGYVQLAILLGSLEV